MIKLFSKRYRVFFTSIVIVVALLIVNSCTRDEEPATENEYIYEAFKEWYLWYDQIPEINPNDYKTQKELIDAIKVDADRWSFSGSYSEIMKLLQGGEYTGFGAGFILDSDKRIKITSVYTNSPLGKFGVERGWIVESINGYGISDLENVNKALSSTENVEFVFLDNVGAHKTTIVKKEPITMNTVMYSNTYEIGSHKIGYLVFDAFLNVSEDELKTEFQKFEQQKITDLIVDLRYNGGGVVDIAHLMVGMIGGSKVKSEVISKIMHNNKKAENDKATVSDYEGPMVNIDKVYFLTSSGTASASEMVINSLQPFMEVKLIGSTTHGKPVGMYVFSIEKLDLAIAPICFKNANKTGFGDYYQGIPVQIEEIDDLSHNWGDKEEAMLKAALTDIVEPVIAINSSAKSSLIKQQRLFEYQGLNQFINAW